MLKKCAPRPKSMREAEGFEGNDARGRQLGLRMCRTQRARPAVARAIQHSVKPDALTTVFAGQDVEAVQRARSYFTGYPPSSPQIGLLKDGKLVYLLERHQIEGRTAGEIADDLVGAFDRYCETPMSAQAANEFLAAKEERPRRKTGPFFMLTRIVRSFQQISVEFLSREKRKAVRRIGCWR